MRLEKELNLSKERFILHYRSKYTSPTEPACWMSLEVASFGWLSSLFANLKTCPEKRAVLKFYGLNKNELLENRINSDNQFSTALRELISSCPLAQEHEMGFLKGWDQELLWQPVTGS